MIGRCKRCNAELGPWEDDAGCVSCVPPWRWTQADRAIAVLEGVEIPLFRWDIQREIRRNTGVHVGDSSLGTVLADDYRACWAGPGLYGLYRHGLLPGLRDIGSAAAVYVHVSDRQLRLDEIHFILRHAGYRYAGGSLDQGLARVWDQGAVHWKWGTYRGRRDNVQDQRAVARTLRLGRRGPVFRAVVERASGVVEEALAERGRRLNRAGLL